MIQADKLEIVVESGGSYESAATIQVAKSNSSDDSEEWFGLNEGESGWLDGFGSDSAIDD